MSIIIKLLGAFMRIFSVLSFLAREFNILSNTVLSPKIILTRFFLKNKKFKLNQEYY